MIEASQTRSAAFGAALAAFIIVILVAAPQAQQAAGVRAGAARRRRRPRIDAERADRHRPPGRPLDGPERRRADRARVADRARRRRRAGHRAGAAADPRQAAGHDLDVRLGQGGRDQDLRSQRAPRPQRARRADEAAVPGEPITVAGSGKDVVLSGTVSSKYVDREGGDVAAGYVEKKENVVNLLKQQEGVASNQVMLRVRFAEVSRSALQELGASFVANGYKNDWFGRTTTQQFPRRLRHEIKHGKLVFSDFLNLFLFNTKEGLGGVVKALQSKGLFQSLAEPNLIATNGKEASFLAGGEYPYPVVQPAAAAATRSRSCSRSSASA